MHHRNRHQGRFPALQRAPGARGHVPQRAPPFRAPTGGCGGQLAGQGTVRVPGSSRPFVNCERVPSAMSIMPIFDKHPDEGAIVGRLLSGYGELEFGLCHCIGEAIGNIDTVLKAMFRVRSEKSRLDVADALGRAPYRALQLETPFAEAVSAIHYCRQIRNQFAHSHWYDADPTGRLGFVSLDEVASENRVVDFQNLPVKYVDVALLQGQERYFKFTSDCLSHLNFEASKKAGRLTTNPFQAPKKFRRPPLCIG